MSCLALSLQPSNGSDILLQTREWFPPSRALVATSAFRQARVSLASSKNTNQSPSTEWEDLDAVASLGDDPLAASSGQIIVGIESRYRVIYRLVNEIYVLAITVAEEHDSKVNTFECINIVNQTVSVLVAACRGVDVTPEKLSRRYAEIYMVLDIVLRGVSSIRLAAMLGSLHGEGIAKLVNAAIETETKVRGAEPWAGTDGHSMEHQASMDSFLNVVFELPPETLASGDEVIAKQVPERREEEEQEETVKKETQDPFAASEAINKDEVVADFKKDKTQSKDLTLALAGLEVTTLPPAEATKATRISVEGFEGDYGGIEFSNEQSSLSETFEGFNDAWGGGLDASEFVGPKTISKKQGLSGLELLEANMGKDKDSTFTSNPANPVDSLVQKAEMKGPEMYIVEEISAEFRESLLARIGLMGVLYLKTVPSDKETEFSFRVENTSAVKRFVISTSKVSSIGDGMFHVRTPSSNAPLPIIKYSLLPKRTPLPLRVRLTQRLSGTLLSVMIQYVSSPELSEPLTDVTFIVKLPVDPTLLKVTPKAVLNRSERELKWVVKEIPLKGSTGKLRARMPVDCGDDFEVVGSVKFSKSGSSTLSGVSVRHVNDDQKDFYLLNHRFEAANFTCT